MATEAELRELYKRSGQVCDTAPSPPVSQAQHAGRHRVTSSRTGTPAPPASARSCWLSCGASTRCASTRCVRCRASRAAAGDCAHAAQAFAALATPQWSGESGDEASVRPGSAHARVADAPPHTRERWQAAGLEAVREGKLALVLLAGAEASVQRSPSFDTAFSPSQAGRARAWAPRFPRGCMTSVCLRKSLSFRHALRCAGACEARAGN